MWNAADHISASTVCVHRKHDYEHYLCTLLLPRFARKAVFAIRAFNVEVALIGDVVTERQRALVRMNFWRDTLVEVFEVSEVNASPQTCRFLSLLYVYLIFFLPSLIGKSSSAACGHSSCLCRSHCWWWWYSWSHDRRLLCIVNIVCMWVQALEDHRISKHWFTRLLDARVRNYLATLQGSKELLLTIRL